MSQYFQLHQQNPQRRLLKQAVQIIRRGGVIVYPTDAAYALGCQIGDKAAMQRLVRIRQLDDKHNFTILCRDLSELATYANVENSEFRLLKKYLPGPFTFILRASREVPRRLLHSKRKTIGLRVPDHVIVQTLLEQLDAPLLTSTLILPGDEAPMTDPELIREKLQHQLDLVIDGGAGRLKPTSVIDLTSGVPIVIREGLGDVSDFDA